ncbi:MAG: hypothetical protein OEZ43_06715 [Gammaproteobacteria bacterium]|nr:hypothetical protein [Gammaproteobacteria bacterium]
MTNSVNHRLKELMLLYEAGAIDQAQYRERREALVQVFIKDDDTTERVAPEHFELSSTYNASNTEHRFPLVTILALLAAAAILAFLSFSDNDNSQASDKRPTTSISR